MNETWNTSSKAPKIPIWDLYRTSLIIWYVVALAVTICGTLMNSALMIAISTSRRLRSGSGYLILHLLFANWLECAIFVPTLATSVFYGQTYQHFRPSFCQYIFFGFSTVTYVVNWTLLAIAANRFVAICFPHSYARWSSGQATLCMIAASWGICFAFNTEMNYGIGGWFGVTPPWGTCGVKGSTSWFTVVVIVCDAVPIILATILYIAIFVVIRVHTNASRRRVAAANEDSKRTGVMEKRYNSAKLMFWAAMWYAVTLFPAPVAAGVFPVAYGGIPTLSLVFRLLLFLAYATTPVRYVVPLDRHTSGL